MHRAALVWSALSLFTFAAVPVSAAQEWTSVNGNADNHRYSALEQINRKTVTKLGAVWVSEPFLDSATSRMTPLVHDGLMFFGAGAHVYALDARTGKVVWTHQTESRRSASRSNGLDFDFESMISGMATTRAWGLGLGGGLVYIGMVNGHMIALDEKTGRLVWDRLISDEPLAISKGILAPPLYVNGVLLFGLGQETTEGRAVAVNARTGDVVWRTPMVAEPGRPGHETWPVDSAIWRSGGAHPWVAAAADPEMKLVYFVTGNAGPAYGGSLRPGDNLHSVSVVALDMDTGKLRWARQLIHHDVWEADLSVSPVLLDWQHEGRIRKAIAVMRGDGYLFLFDRLSGEPLLPVEERAVPQNPALFTAATQPFPVGADSILPPCHAWQDKIPAGFVLGCMFDAPSHEAPNKLMQYASVRIAPMAYDPKSHYVFAQGANSLMWLGTGDDPFDMVTNVNGARIPNFPRPTAVVAAIDSRTDKVVWRKELPSYDDSGYKSNGGSLSTAGGLLFHQGGDGTLQAYDSMTGKTLWSFQIDYAVGDASPMSYAVGKTQYVAFIAGSKIWAFSLGGSIAPAAPMSRPAYETVRGPIQDTTQIETFSYEHEPSNGLRYRLNEFAFNPYRTRVAAGTPLTFINNGRLPHTVVSQDGSWTTGRMDPTQVVTITIDKPGSYLFTSKEYPWSFGELIVTSAPPAQATAAALPSGAAEQSDRGKALFGTACASCHGDDLAGTDRGLSLVGERFDASWAGHEASALFDRMRSTMPAAAPGSLADDEYAALVAYVLKANDRPASVVLDKASMSGITIRSR